MLRGCAHLGSSNIIRIYTAPHSRTCGWNNRKYGGIASSTNVNWCKSRLFCDGPNQRTEEATRRDERVRCPVIICAVLCDEDNSPSRLKTDLSSRSDRQKRIIDIVLEVEGKQSLVKPFLTVSRYRVINLS